MSSRLVLVLPGFQLLGRRGGEGGPTAVVVNGSTGWSFVLVPRCQPYAHMCVARGHNAPFGRVDMPVARLERPGTCLIRLVVGHHVHAQPEDGYRPPVEHLGISIGTT